MPLPLPRDVSSNDPSLSSLTLARYTRNPQDTQAALRLSLEMLSYVISITLISCARFNLR